MVCEGTERYCDDPSTLVGACASVGIEHGMSTGDMALLVVCDECPLRQRILEARHAGTFDDGFVAGLRAAGWRM